MTFQSSRARSWVAALRPGGGGASHAARWGAGSASPITLERLETVARAAGVRTVVSAAVDVESRAVRLEVQAPAHASRELLGQRLGRALLGTGTASRLRVEFVQAGGDDEWTADPGALQ